MNSYKVTRRIRRNDEPSVVLAESPLEAWVAAGGARLGVRAVREGSAWTMYDGPSEVALGRVRPVTACVKCAAEVDNEPGVGLVDVLSGDDGGTYDRCTAGGRHELGSNRAVELLARVFA